MNGSVREVKIQILYLEDCPWYKKTEAWLKEIGQEINLPLQLELVQIQNPEQAEKEKFPGSPTVRINGKDLEEWIPSQISRDFLEKQKVNWGCRRYFYSQKFFPYPPKELLKEALNKILNS